MKCSGKGNNIIANINYSYKSSQINSGLINEKSIKNYFHIFGENNFQLNYSKINSTEFGLEIFTPDYEEEKAFDVIFEDKHYTVNNKNVFVFRKTKTEYKAITINSNENIEAIISASASAMKSKDNQDDYSKMFLNGDNSFSYQFFGINHEYNTNYYFDVEVKNLLNNALSFCYYVPTMAIIYSTGQNCILMPASETTTISLGQIFKKTNEENFNIEEPMYHFIAYSDNPDAYQYTKINFKIDLEKSTPFNSFEGFNKYGKYFYIEADLKKDEKSYFNIPLPNSNEYNHLDLIILNEISKSNELKFDLKCIMEYELAIKFIEPYFEEEKNNICHLINKNDYNSNAYHFIFNSTKKIRDDIFLIRIIPKEDMKVRFITNEGGYIFNNFKFSDGLQYFYDPYYYQIYEIKRDIDYGTEL